MKTMYKTGNYHPKQVVTRYVCAAPEGYKFCEVNKDHYDIHQGIVDAEEIPDDIRKKADELYMSAFGYVEWPFMKEIEFKNIPVIGWFKESHDSDVWYMKVSNTQAMYEIDGTRYCPKFDISEKVWIEKESEQ